MLDKNEFRRHISADADDCLLGFAALGAISEDSSILGKSLIFVGLAEGVCRSGGHR